MSAAGRSSPRCAHKRSKTMASCFFPTRFAWKESVMMKPTPGPACVSRLAKLMNGISRVFASIAVVIQ